MLGIPKTLVDWITGRLGMNLKHKSAYEHRSNVVIGGRLKLQEIN